MDELEYLFIGEGDVTVVFLNGFRMSFDSWDKVHSEISKECNVLIYNRYGVGKSKKSTAKQNGNTVVEGLRSLVKQLQLKSPLIIVAHSLGGIYANLYARKYSDEICAVIFVDSSHPDEIAKQKSIKSPSILSCLNNSIKAVEKLFDHYRYSEDEEIEVTLDQLREAGAFPLMPIAIVSGTKKPPFLKAKAHQLHQKYQIDLGNISSQTRQYECSKSGHFPQVTEPKIVINAIFDTISIVKKSMRTADKVPVDWDKHS